MLFLVLPKAFGAVALRQQVGKHERANAIHDNTRAVNDARVVSSLARIFNVLIVDEVNANNEDIEQQSISFRTEIEDFFDRVYKVFGYKVDVYDMNEMFKEAEDEVDEKEEDQDGEY